MKIDREVAIRKIIKEIKQTDLPRVRVGEIASKWLGRLQQLEARIEGVLDFMGDGGTEFDNGVVFALKKILGEKDAKKTKEKKD